MVQVGGIDSHSQQAGHDHHAGGLPPACRLLLPDGLNQIGHRHQQHHRQEVIGHLYVVGQDLQCEEERRHQPAPQVFAAIAPHQARDGRRDIGQSEQFPNVPGPDDDEEIGREGPQDRSQRRHPDLEIERPQQDVESQQHDEHIHDVGRKPQLVNPLQAFQRVRGFVTGGHLVGGHPGEQGVRPARPLARALIILLHLYAGPSTRAMVVPGQDQPLRHRMEEIQEANHDEQDYSQHVRQITLKLIHVYY